MFNTLLHSGWKFTTDEQFIKSRYEMLNISILLSLFALTFGIFNNLLAQNGIIVTIEIAIFILTLGCALLLRAKRAYLLLVTNYLALQFLLFFVSLILFSAPEQMKHLWIFTFPLVIFFFKGSYIWIYWIFTLCILLLMVKVQPFYPSQYTMFQIFYIELVIIIMTAIIYYYDYKISCDHDTITKQNASLNSFSQRLEEEVAQKTQELEESKLKLEVALLQKNSELKSQKEMMILQSRQATMGELFTMIAHQWRQPLSNMSLQIVNRRMENPNMTLKEDHFLESLELSIEYLAETLDNFQTFFRPQSTAQFVEVIDIFQQLYHLVEPRLVFEHITLEYDKQECTLKTFKNDLLQVLLILVNNAIDAYQNSILEQKKIIMTLHAQQQCYITVKDSAGGITSDNIDDIFEPYYSTKNSELQTQKQTLSAQGIGLHIAQLIVTNKLGGTIGVKNVHEGAAFTITLPLQWQGNLHE